MTIFMCVATGRRAPPRRLLIWLSSTISTAFSSRWTPSTEFRDLAINWTKRPRVTGRRWSATSSISASTVTTCLKSAIGVGPCESDASAGQCMTDAEPELNVLALNSGSSSLKFGLYCARSSRIEMLLSGEAESIGNEGGKFHAEDAAGNVLFSEIGSIPSQREAVVRIGRLLSDTKMRPAVIGHRIVHGGPKLRQHCLIDDTVLIQLEAATAFAPLHIPSALSVIRFAQEHFPGLPQAACFDTTFHAGLPAVARVLPIAKELQSEGIQRYGFHGLSCESIVHQLANDLPKRLVIAHLGSGASVTAVKAGKSIDTSMGLTPT